MISALVEISWRVEKRGSHNDLSRIFVIGAPIKKKANSLTMCGDTKEKSLGDFHARHIPFLIP